ncbi:hypothetical protein GCM10029964_085300 [Kibdelosporangium lantanae]
MSTLRCHISISLDGYVAGPAQSAEDPLGVDGEKLHDWVEQASSDGARWADRSWSIAPVHGSGRAYPNFPIRGSTAGRTPTMARTFRA